eukprot:1413439-Rhodomonas_salina.1
MGARAEPRIRARALLRLGATARKVRQIHSASSAQSVRACLLSLARERVLRCICVRPRERERESARAIEAETERETETGTETETYPDTDTATEQ